VFFYGAAYQKSLRAVFMLPEKGVFGTKEEQRAVAPEGSSCPRAQQTGAESSLLKIIYTKNRKSVR